MKQIRLWLLIAIAISCGYCEFAFADSIPALDLTIAGSNGFVGDAFFQTIGYKSAGTGEIESFLTINGKGKRSEKGYNTDGAVEKGFDMARTGGAGDSGFTRSLKLSDVPVVTLDGIAYRQFLLDINESNGNNGDSRLSLDALQIYQAGTPDLDSFRSVQSNFSVFDLDYGKNRWIGLNDLRSGSGSGDVFVYIPNSRFSADSSIPYIYLYSQFGNQRGWESSGGFEEWAVLENKTPAQTPEPASLLLLATGIAGIGLLAFRKKR